MSTRHSHDMSLLHLFARRRSSTKGSMRSMGSIHMSMVSITSLPSWDDRTPLAVHFEEDFKPHQSMLTTGGDVSSPFLPSLRAVDDARRAVVQLAQLMDSASARNVPVRCVAFQDAAQSRAVVCHIVSVHRDASASPVIHVRYRLVADGPAVMLNGQSPKTCLIKTKAGGLCVIKLSPRAQLILLGVLDGNRYSGRFALPPSNVSDMEPSYIACIQTFIPTPHGCNTCDEYGLGACDECQTGAVSTGRVKIGWRNKTLRFWRRRRAQMRRGKA